MWLKFHKDRFIGFGEITYTVWENFVSRETRLKYFIYICFGKVQQKKIDFLRVSKKNSPLLVVMNKLVLFWVVSEKGPFFREEKFPCFTSSRFFAFSASQVWSVRRVIFIKAGRLLLSSLSSTLFTLSFFLIALLMPSP